MLTQAKYVMKTGGQIIVYEAPTRSLCAAIPCEVAEGDESGQTTKHTMTIVNKDGTLMQKTIDTLKEVFGWDGVNPFWLMFQNPEVAADETPRDLSEVRFELTGGIEKSDKGTDYWKGQWLNPLGGAAKMPEPADRKSVLAKYGSKFRALAGGAPVAKPATGAKPAAKPPTPPAKKSPPTPQTGPTSDMETCWKELCEANAGKSEEELNTLWFAEIERHFPGKTNSDLTPHDWGKFKARSITW